ncbi:hypothetical protein [Ferrovibrio terrae]|uniref:hypothetical protein n=1 Tax=Ferrovibrio terrae TaxID=2594003 RepID=UPI00163DC760|nr:hypothetical protein [Ferrovibrio terrae]
MHDVFKLGMAGHGRTCLKREKPSESGMFIIFRQLYLPNPEAGARILPPPLKIKSAKQQAGAGVFRQAERSPIWSKVGLHSLTHGDKVGRFRSGNRRNGGSPEFLAVSMNYPMEPGRLA